MPQDDAAQYDDSRDEIEPNSARAPNGMSAGVGRKAAIGAASALTGGVGGAALKIGDKAIQLADKIPGFGSLSKLVAKNRWVFLAIIIFFVIAMPAFGFVVGISALGGGIGTLDGGQSSNLYSGGSVSASNIISVAMGYIDKLSHYDRGSRTNFSAGYCDCSSFVSKVLKDIGVPLSGYPATGTMADLWDSGNNQYVKPVLLPHAGLTQDQARQLMSGDIIIWGNAYSEKGAHTAIIESVDIEEGIIHYIDCTSKLTGRRSKGGVDQRTRTIGSKVWGVYRVVGSDSSSPQTSD